MKQTKGKKLIKSEGEKVESSDESLSKSKENKDNQVEKRLVELEWTIAAYRQNYLLSDLIIWNKLKFFVFEF